jgi:hypothetical protein
MSKIIRWHATPTHYYHAAHPFQTAYWWACPLSAPASPNFLMSFRLMKECVASLSSHKTFQPFIWASRYQRLGLGARLLALATKPMSNIQFTAMIQFVFAPQGNFLTFGARPKYDLPKYHKTIVLYTIRGINMICLGSTKPPSNIPSTAQS